LLANVAFCINCFTFCITDNKVIQTANIKGKININTKELFYIMLFVMGFITEQILRKKIKRKK